MIAISGCEETFNQNNKTILKTITYCTFKYNEYHSTTTENNVDYFFSL